MEGKRNEVLAISPFSFCTVIIYYGDFSVITNTSFFKWERLAKKQLDYQFVNEMTQGLQCSPFEAGAILDSVHKVYGSYFETSGTLKPGQIQFQLIP